MRLECFVFAKMMGLNHAIMVEPIWMNLRTSNILAHRNSISYLGNFFSGHHASVVADESFILY